jgi:flavin-dependent dehydrogenase
VEVREGIRVDTVVQWRDGVTLSFPGGSLDAAYVAIADGLGSLVPRERRGGLRERYGFRRHYRVAPWSSMVEVHWTDGAEAYVTPVSEDEVGIAILWHRPASSWESMLSRFGALARHLGSASPITTVQGAGPFRRRTRRAAGGRVALVGDASGYVDAITGEGIAIAFECARALARSLRTADLRVYERAHRSILSRYRRTTEFVLALAAFPFLRHGVVSVLSEQSWLFDHCLRLAQPNARGLT